MFRYSKKQLHFLRRGYLKWQILELTRRFNFRFKKRKLFTSIKAALSNHGFKCGRPVGSPVGTYRIVDKKQARFIKIGMDRAD